MPAANVAAQVRTSLASLKASDLKDAQIMEVLKLAHQLTDTMKLFFSSLDQSICQEFNYIADYISRTRDEISALRPNDIKSERIPPRPVSNWKRRGRHGEGDRDDHECGGSRAV